MARTNLILVKSAPPLNSQREQSYFLKSYRTIATSLTAIKIPIKHVTSVSTLLIVILSSSRIGSKEFSYPTAVTRTASGSY